MAGEAVLREEDRREHPKKAKSGGGGGQGRRIGDISGTAGAIGAIRVASESPHQGVLGPRSDKGTAQKPSTYMQIILPPLWTPKCEYLRNGKGNARCKNGYDFDEYDGTRD